MRLKRFDERSYAGYPWVYFEEGGRHLHRVDLPDGLAHVIVDPNEVYSTQPVAHTNQGL